METDTTLDVPSEAARSADAESIIDAIFVAAANAGAAALVAPRLRALWDSSSWSADAITAELDAISRAEMEA